MHFRLKHIAAVPSALINKAYSVFANNTYISAITLAIACGLSHSSLAAERPAAPVFIYEAQAGSLSQRLEFLGRVSAVESVDLSPSVTQTVSAIHFSDGQKVKAGDILIEITSAEEHGQLEQLRSQVSLAQQDYDRIIKLKAAKLTSEESIDQKRTALESAQGQLKAAQARVAARLIQAPFSGTLGLRHISVGTLVRPGEVIASLEDNSKLNLDIDVPESLARFINAKPDFEASSLGGDIRITGKVEQVDNRTNSQTHNIIARAKLANPAGELRSGMALKVQFTREFTDQLRLPESALIQEGTLSYVFVLQPDNKAKRQQVKLGLRQPGFVGITEGLKVGDKVITHGASRLTTGDAVKIVGQDQGQPLGEILTGDER